LLTWWGFLAWPVLRFADYSLHPLFAVLSVPFFVSGLLMFRRAHHELGREFSPTLEIKSGHRLHYEGAYFRLRHPMYASVLLMGLGQLLLVPNLIIGPLSLVGSVAVLFWRIPYEEAMMSRAFGNSWEWYCARSWRLVPGVW